MAFLNLKKRIRQWLAEGDETPSPDAALETTIPPQTQESLDAYIAALRDAARKAYPGADFIIGGSMNGESIGFSSYVVPYRPSGIAALFILATRPDINEVAFSAVREYQKKINEAPVNINKMFNRGGDTDDKRIIEEYEALQKNKIKPH